MKVLQLTKHYPPHFGGIESVTADITIGLNNRNIHSDVLCSNIIPKTVVEQHNGYTVTRCRRFAKLFSTSFSPTLILHLWKCCKDYDIIHVHFPDPLAALALFIVRPKAKLVLYWHSDVVKQKLLLRFYNPFQNWVLRRSAVIIGSSPAYVASSSVLQNFSSKVIAIPYGIRSNYLPVKADLSSAIRDKHFGKKIIFALGRLVYYKGFEYLIEAAQLLDEHTVVLIGGTGELEKALQQKIIQLGLSKKVFLVGRVSDQDLGSYYASCDIFCFPSVERSEAFGVVQLEAMLFGKPIVAAEVPHSGVSWVNQNGVSGFNVPVRNAKALADKINLLLTDQNLYTNIATQSKKRYQDHFTADKMVESIIEVYKKSLLHD